MIPWSLIKILTPLLTGVLLSLGISISLCGMKIQWSYFSWKLCSESPSNQVNLSILPSMGWSLGWQIVEQTWDHFSSVQTRSSVLAGILIYLVAGEIPKASIYLQIPHNVKSGNMMTQHAYDYIHDYAYNSSLDRAKLRVQLPLRVEDYKGKLCIANKDINYCRHSIKKWRFLKKWQTEWPYAPAIFLVDIHPKEDGIWQKYWHFEIHFRTIHNSQEVKTNSMSIHRWPDNESVVFI